MKTWEQTLAECLAHTLVWDAQETERRAGLAPGSVRADFGTDVDAPDPAATANSTILAQMQAMRGIGPFKNTGSIPGLIKEFTPQFVDTSLANTDRYLRGSENAPGMLQQYSETIQPALNQVATTQRAADVADVATLGPAAREALRTANPEAARLLDSLTTQAQTQVDTNGALDPFTRRLLQQDIRGAQAARGFGTGTSDAAAEAYYEAATREQRRAQNQQLASSVAQQTNALYGDPFMAILGRASSQPAMAAWGQGSSGAASATSPVNSAFDLNSPLSLATYQGQLKANLASAQNSNDLFGGLMGGAMGMGGSIFGAAGSAGGFGSLFCWAAREVFGEQDVRWRQFRAWMLLDAPNKLRRWYVRHGSQWAARLRHNALARTTVRRWMLKRLHPIPL